jgi:uncharacterized membrane protein
VSSDARSRGWVATALIAGATAGTTLVLDLTWLGVAGRGLYASALGSLQRDSPYLPAAGLFYALYVAAIVHHAVFGGGSVLGAAKRGAALGLVVYASYDLTNWAVLRGWPAFLVPIDIAWGVVLTATAAGTGKLVQERLLTRVAR